MVRTRNVDEVAIFNFQMVLSIAHEITHFLTGFFTGTARPLTPREVAAAGWRGSTGEAGRYWEEKFIGGVVEFYADPRYPRNADQAGIPYIFDNFNEDSRGTFVSKNYIDAIFNGCKLIPFPDFYSVTNSIRAQPSSCEVHKRINYNSKICKGYVEGNECTSQE